MERSIWLLAEFINALHDLVLAVARTFDFSMTDKELHFWLVGLLGIAFFLVIHLLFKRIARWSITALSFIYTFTLLVVFVFAVEIEQKITGRGNMELKDAEAGLYGFLAFFTVYLLISFSLKLLHKLFNRIIKR
ncbi:hypothetical protein RDV78_04280 [Bacillota bacterium LX-D]|nr:hypothetical protein [Bacillota bacterium LX-D]